MKYTIHFTFINIPPLFDAVFLLFVHPLFSCMMLYLFVHIAPVVLQMDLRRLDIMRCPRNAAVSGNIFVVIKLVKISSSWRSLNRQNDKIFIKYIIRLFYYLFYTFIS